MGGFSCLESKDSVDAFCSLLPLRFGVLWRLSPVAGVVDSSLRYFKLASEFLGIERNPRGSLMVGKLS